MRSVHVLAVVLTTAALAAAFRGTDVHPSHPAWALFSFAVSAFREPLR